MTSEAALLLFGYLLLLAITVKPMGSYLARVMEGTAPLVVWCRPLERTVLRVCGCRPDEEMEWRRYALAALLFSGAGALVLYALQRLQNWLPLNPQKFAAVASDSAFNTAVSFVTNTNWQSYGGESTMSYLTQMVGLTVQNFASAALGIAVAFALMRGFARHSSDTLGNFWVDLYRATFYVLLPLSVVFALLLVSQGVIQNFQPYPQVTTLEPIRYQTPKLDAASQPRKGPQGNSLTETISSNTQTIAMGPVASQVAIKMLGTNGGGFFNANSAHPYENPTPLTNLLQMLSIFLIPAGLCYAFGRVVGDMRQCWAILGAMTVLFVAMALIALAAEQAGNPSLAKLGIDTAAGNWEGKETRFGIAASALFATITTAASCGAVNAMHDSFTPLGGLVPMFLMQLGEPVFGGVGSGLYMMLLYTVLAVFIAGLMIGRTPEYLGKKIDGFDIKMVSIAVLASPALTLLGTALSVTLSYGRVGILNPGAHGFSEILYAFSSAANNNGSAFAGLSANTPYYNTATAVAMWFGRYVSIIALLALAGALAHKKRIPVGDGTMPTHGPLFVGLLIGTVLLVGALTFIPALALGPLAEHLILWNDR